MSDLQTLFTILFGIYFATTVATSGSFKPFDTSAAVAGDWRALMRLVVAVVMLDVVPFVYFVTILGCLPEAKQKLTDVLLPGFGVLFAALGGFGIYRIFCGLMFVPRGNQYWFYSSATEVANKYSPAPAPQEKRSSVHVIVGGVIWLVACVVLFVIFR